MISQPPAHPAGLWSPSSPSRRGHSSLSLGFLLGRPRPQPTLSAFPSLQRDLDPGSALSDADMVPLLLLPLLWGGEWPRVLEASTGWGGAAAAAEALCPPRVPAGEPRVRAQIEGIGDSTGGSVRPCALLLLLPLESAVFLWCTLHLLVPE